jgi:hypothetical protein
MALLLVDRGEVRGVGKKLLSADLRCPQHESQNKPFHMQFPAVVFTPAGEAGDHWPVRTPVGADLPFRERRPLTG